MKFNVYEMITDIKPVGYAEEIKPGEIHIKLKDKTLILLNKQEEQKRSSFENKIIEKINNETTYKIEFKKEAIKEISQSLNQHYQNIISSSVLKEKLKPFLIKYGYASNIRNASYAYIKYFVIDGLLKKDDNVYVIIRNNVIPKKEKESRGFLDELGMS